MKKILLPNSLPTLYFSMLLAIGLLSACSSDDDGNPFVGEWQLIEVRYKDSGEIAYPTGKDEDANWYNYAKFLPDFEYKAFRDSIEIRNELIRYCYDADILTFKFVARGVYYSEKYEFSEKGTLLKLSEYETNEVPGINPRRRTISIYKKVSNHE